VPVVVWIKGGYVCKEEVGYDDRESSVPYSAQEIFLYRKDYGMYTQVECNDISRDE
jgi:hypothetical protein